MLHRLNPQVCRFQWQKCLLKGGDLSRRAYSSLKPPLVSPKDLFILMDGTGRSPEAARLGKRAPTNVQILREELGDKLVNADMDEGWEVRTLKRHSRPGLLFYDRGLGSPNIDDQGNLIKWSLRPLTFFKNPMEVYSRFLENDYFERLTAFGILDNVAQAYEFLVENYHPQDRVFLFGFSRGAYTLRLLVQLIRYFGLIRKDRFRNDPDLIEKAFLVYNSRIHPRDNAEVKAFRAANCLLPSETHHEGMVHFMGLWDTVRGYVIERVHEDSRLNNVVKRARHALALDEMRPRYKPEIWTKNNEDALVKDADHLQLWFPGCHSDVGGSYFENGLSNVSLNWMVNEADLNREHFLNRYPPDPLAMEHDSYNTRLHENVNLTWAMLSVFAQLDRLANVPVDADNLGFHPSVTERAGKTVLRLGKPYVYPDHIARFQALERKRADSLDKRRGVRHETSTNVRHQ